jgi:hypothetical protein
MPRCHEFSIPLYTSCRISSQLSMRLRQIGHIPLPKCCLAYCLSDMLEEMKELSSIRCFICPFSGHQAHVVVAIRCLVCLLPHWIRMLSLATHDWLFTTALDTSASIGHTWLSGCNKALNRSAIAIVDFTKFQLSVVSRHDRIRH